MTTVSTGSPFRAGIQSFVGHIPFHHADAAAEQLLIAIFKIVEQLGLQPCLGLHLAPAPQQAVGRALLRLQESAQQVDAQKARHPCEQQVADLAGGAPRESVEGVGPQQRRKAVVVEARYICRPTVRLPCFHSGGQPPGSGVGEDIPVGDGDALVVGFHNDAGHREGGAAQLEEVVGGAHTVHPQALGKDAAENLLAPAPGRFTLCPLGERRERQRLDVRFPVGCHGHGIQLAVGRGDHVGRQGLRQGGFHFLGADGPAGGEPGAEVFSPGNFPDAHLRLLHQGLRQDSFFDFPQFDAQSSQFHLAVGAPQDDHIALGRPSGVIAGFIHPPALIEDKFLFRQRLLAEVAPGHPCAADVQLPHHAHGQLVFVAVHDVFPNVQQRRPDGHPSFMGQLFAVGGDGDLRGAVGIENAPPGDGFQLSQQLGRVLFAAAHHHPAAREGLAESRQLDVLGHPRGCGVEGIAAVVRTYRAALSSMMWRSRSGG